MNTAHSIKMLSIDDRSLTTDLDRAGYRNMGVVVKPAKSFNEAEEILSKEGVDLIVINYDYNKVNATQICQHFKAQSHIKEIPIVITSVQTSAQTRNAALDAGADLFVEQPLPRQYFIEKLKRLLAQKTRSTERVNVHGTAVISYDGEARHCPIGDLSTSGVLLAVTLDINAGQAVELSFNLPGYKKPITVTGEVVRTLKPTEVNQISGIGIRFKEFLGDSQRRLERYVSKTADDQSRMLYYL